MAHSSKDQPSAAKATTATVNAVAAMKQGAESASKSALAAGPADKKPVAASAAVAKTGSKPEAKKEKGSLKWFLAGGIAGSAEAITCSPFDVIKTRMANKKGLYTGPFNGLYTAAKNEGILTLWSGFLPFLTQLSMKASIRFYTYEMSKRVLIALDKDGSNKVKIDALAGAFGGAAEGIVWTTPLERLKILKQSGTLPKTASNFSALSTCFKQQGVFGGVQYLYKGVVWTVMRQASSTTVRFPVYNQTVILMGYENKPAPVYVSFAAGMAAGLLGVVVNQPIEVVKTRVQAMAGNQRASFFGALKMVMADGPTAFYGGLSARLLRIGLGQAFVFSGYEYARRLLDKLLPS